MVSADMLNSHPGPAQIDRAMLAQTLESVGGCALACKSCADACLAEQSVAELRRCVRLNLDCSDICVTTAALLVRQTEPGWRIVRAQLQACATACQVCAEECERHASHHEHCRICAEHCRACADACQQFLNNVPA